MWLLAIGAAGPDEYCVFSAGLVRGGALRSCSGQSGDSVSYSRQGALRGHVRTTTTPEVKRARQGQARTVTSDSVVACPVTRVREGQSRKATKVPPRPLFPCRRTGHGRVLGLPPGCCSPLEVGSPGSATPRRDRGRRLRRTWDGVHVRPLNRVPRVSNPENAWVHICPSRPRAHDPCPVRGRV